MASDAANLVMREFLGLAPTPVTERWRLTVTEAICGGRDSIYGGCALAACIEAAEGYSGRSTVWASVHFLRPAHAGQSVTLSVSTGAAGRAVSHLRVEASVDGEPVFSAFVAAGERRFPAEQAWVSMPSVPPPEALPARYIREANRGGLRRRMHERAVTTDPDGVMREPSGRAAVWVTLDGGVPACASALAVVGDEVSTGSSAVLDPDMQAPSSDNTLRVLRPHACDWVLADIELRGASRGFVHGFINLWSPDGTLLGIASQTGALRIRGT